MIGENMDDREFWTTVFLESNKKVSHEWAIKAADEAVAGRNKTAPLGKLSGKPSLESER